MTHEAGVKTAPQGYNPRAATVEDGLEWSNLRARLGWSIREMEAKTGINRGTLSMIENGRIAPKLAQARRILAVYDQAMLER